MLLSASAPAFLLYFYLCMLLSVSQDPENNWQFDIFGFADATPGATLSLLAFHLYTRTGMMQHYNLDPAKLLRYYQRIEQGYVAANPYHNRLLIISLSYSVSQTQSLILSLATSLHVCLHDQSSALLSLDLVCVIRISSPAYCASHRQRIQCAPLFAASTSMHYLCVHIFYDHHHYLHHVCYLKHHATDKQPCQVYKGTSKYAWVSVCAAIMQMMHLCMHACHAAAPFQVTVDMLSCMPICLKLSLLYSSGSRQRQSLILVAAACSIHVASVLQMTHLLLCHGGIMKSNALSSNDLVSGYWSAVTHDYEHGGLNNDFLIKTLTHWLSPKTTCLLWRIIIWQLLLGF